MLCCLDVNVTLHEIYSPSFDFAISRNCRHGQGRDSGDYGGNHNDDHRMSDSSMSRHPRKSEEKHDPPNI